MATEEDTAVRVARLEERGDASQKTLEKLVTTVERIDERTRSMQIQQASASGAENGKGNLAHWALSVVTAVAVAAQAVFSVTVK